MADLLIELDFLVVFLDTLLCVLLLTIDAL